jgi:hypothetical protein
MKTFVKIELPEFLFGLLAPVLLVKIFLFFVLSFTMDLRDKIALLVDF